MPDDLTSLETADDPWSAHEDTVKTTGFLAMLRELPALWAQVFREAWRVNPRDTLVMVVTTIVAEIFTAIGLLATTGVLEQLLSDGPTPDRVRDATPALLLVVGSVVLRAALREAGSWASSRLDPQLDRAATTRLLELTTQVELVAYDDGPFHDRLHRVREMAVYALSRLLGISLRLFASAVSLVAVAGVVTVLHPSLLPLLLLAVVPAWWASLRQARMRFSLYTGLSGPSRRMWMLGDLMADRASAAEVRAYTMRPFLVDEYSRVARYVERANLRMARQQSIAGMIGQALGGIGVGIVYVALGLLLYNGAMPLAIAGTAVVAIRTATASLGQVGDSVNQSYEQALFYWDYLDFQAEAQRRLDRRGGTTPPEDLDHIVVDDVSFTYPAGREPALRGVSLEITPGEVIALVGENGSGKSTLAKVISSLYQPAAGTVSYGGVPGGEIDLDRLRAHIAVIAQDFTHWPFTARENITLGAPEPADAATRFAEATRSSGAQDVCNRLEHGYDTLLDPSFKGGTELSGGQWQRIAVARGLYRDAPLLICDEPTAALDARSEHLIFEAIRRHALQRTVVLITHRLASVRYADRIFVLDQGRIVERGTHAELMALAGIYAEFYSLQAQAYEQVP